MWCCTNLERSTLTDEVKANNVKTVKTLVETTQNIVKTVKTVIYSKELLAIDSFFKDFKVFTVFTLFCMVFTKVFTVSNYYV